MVQLKMRNPQTNPQISQMDKCEISKIISLTFMVAIVLLLCQGNYGAPSDERDIYGLSTHFESDKIQVTALIVVDYSFDHSHHSAYRSLSDWLIEHNIPALCGLDNRMITKKIRVEGSMLAKIEFDEQIEFDDPNRRNLVAELVVKNTRNGLLFCQIIVLQQLKQFVPTPPLQLDNCVKLMDLFQMETKILQMIIVEKMMFLKLYTVYTQEVVQVHRHKTVEAVVLVQIMNFVTNKFFVLLMVGGHSGDSVINIAKVDFDKEAVPVHHHQMVVPIALVWLLNPATIM